MKSCCDKGEVAEIEKGASRKDSMSRHHFEIVTQKEDNDGCNILWMSGQVIQYDNSFKVMTENSGHD